MVLDHPNSRCTSTNCRPARRHAFSAPSPGTDVSFENQSGDHAGSDSTDVEIEGTTPREEAALGRVRLLSRVLDDAIKVPGTNFRFGLDPVLGILPVGGDAVAAVISLYPVVEAYRFGASTSTITKMLALIAVDAVVGSIPVIGPVFDAVWKANKWNLRTLERQIQHG